MKVETLLRLILRYGTKIGLTREQKEFIWHIFDHDFKERGFSYPGQKRLAERMGYTGTESIRRLAKTIHEAGWLIVVPGRGRGQSTRYHITKKLVNALQKHYVVEAESAFDNFVEKTPNLFEYNPSATWRKPQKSVDKTPISVGGNPPKKPKKNPVKKYPITSLEFQAAKFISNQIIKNFPTLAGKIDKKDYLHESAAVIADCRKVHESYTPEWVTVICIWVCENGFWCEQFRSVKKLMRPDTGKTGVTLKWIARFEIEMKRANAKKKTTESVYDAFTATKR